MTKKQLNPAQTSGIDVDLSSLDKPSGARREAPLRGKKRTASDKLRAEFAMKVRGTRVTDFPSESRDQFPTGLDLNMFPSAVNGPLLEGHVTMAQAGTYGPLPIACLMTDDGQIFPDDPLFREFAGEHVKVIKSGDVITVKRV
jgi:hypothetical protein